ncbi:hypothetical protein AB1L05_17235 [Cytobacillus horneckiae]|uniref:YunG family protein n=1 Tax=Cytobacillus horneckiae TaxID=549687 RepID=UPI0020423F4F|nr:hypothetical protein [Cytobacillus horneckiae]MCM3176723.1 hypothetical protein [Cytobacillus horneckiae]
MNINKLRKALLTSWSIQTSTKWTAENPAKGQCGVTSLVINDILGGEIKKTLLPEGWNYYNFVGGKRYDFTKQQFEAHIIYSDIASSRAEAMSDTNNEQYKTLKEMVQQQV